MTWYILNEMGEPVPSDLEGFENWLRTHVDQKIVKKSYYGAVTVSTVFLGLNHNYTDESYPVLWETMIFGGPLDQILIRCGGGREQAEAMHHEMCEKTKANLRSEN